MRFWPFGRQRKELIRNLAEILKELAGPEYAEISKFSASILMINNGRIIEDPNKYPRDLDVYVKRQPTGTLLYVIARGEGVDFSRSFCQQLGTSSLARYLNSRYYDIKNVPYTLTVMEIM